jgi:hypothetical protein
MDQHFPELDASRRETYLYVYKRRPSSVNQLSVFNSQLQNSSDVYNFLLCNVYFRPKREHKSNLLQGSHNVACITAVTLKQTLLNA